MGGITLLISFLLLVVVLALGAGACDETANEGPRSRVDAHVARQRAGLANDPLVILADVVARTALSPAEVPIGVITALFGAPDFQNRNSRLLWGVGRLAGGVSSSEVDAELRVVSTRLAADHPVRRKGSWGLSDAPALRLPEVSRRPGDGAPLLGCRRRVLSR